MATAQSRALGGNFHYTFTAQNADGTINSAFGNLTGFLDDVQWRSVITYNTYTPPGVSKPHYQHTLTTWTVTITGADKPNIWTYISQFNEHQRQTKGGEVTISLKVTAYDPDDNTEAFSFSWSDGHLADAGGRANGLHNALESTGTIDFASMG